MDEEQIDEGETIESLSADIGELHKKIDRMAKDLATIKRGIKFECRGCRKVVRLSNESSNWPDFCKECRN